MTTTPSPSDWTIFIANDNCPDYTWGINETTTRRAFADVVRAHLDEMNRTDSQPPENRDHYTMAAANEAICFVERYPERKGELIRRIREGRILVSPFLCNSLWGWQSPEAFVRTFYAARRMEREWGIPIDLANHIEEPSLPWGLAGLFEGCGVRWLQVAFLKYDTTFDQLKTPPVFILEGPDGSQVRVVMDVFASLSAGYCQGHKILDESPEPWIAHYSALGDSYPLLAIFASGTHGDISPRSGSQVPIFANAVIAHNAESGTHPKYINSTLRDFAAVADAEQARRPYLPVIRGCFGHSWEVWPVSLARIAADSREAERSFLAAEALLAGASLRAPELVGSVLATLRRAEWWWAMLGDHAWNGTSQVNKRHNAELRRTWSAELSSAASDVADEAWRGLGLQKDSSRLVLCNALSVPRADLVASNSRRVP